MVAAGVGVIERIPMFLFFKKRKIRKLAREKLRDIKDSEQYLEYLSHSREVLIMLQRALNDLAELDVPLFPISDFWGDANTNRNMPTIQGFATKQFSARYYEVLQKIEELWKNRKQSQSIRQTAIDMCVQLVAVFPIFKKIWTIEESYFSLCGDESILSNLEEIIENGDIDYSSKNLWESTVFITKKNSILVYPEFGGKLESVKNKLEGDSNLQYLRCPAYDRLISLYLLENEPRKAVEVCDIGIELGESTKFVGGFEGKKRAILQKYKEGF